MRRRWSRRCTRGLFAALLVLSGCRSKPEPAALDGAAPRASDSSRGGREESARPKPPIAPESALDLVAELPSSEIVHRGVLIDLGSSSSRGLTGSWGFGADPAFVESEHDG